MGIAEEIQSRKFENNQSKAVVNILYTSNWLRDLHKDLLKKYNLLPQHYNVLRIINGKFPEPVSPSHIKEVMLDKGPDVTRLVDKLVKLELVSRCNNEENKRIVEIRMSENGINTLEEMSREIQTITHQHFGLNNQDSELLSDLLDRARKSNT